MEPRQNRRVSRCVNQLRLSEWPLLPITCLLLFAEFDAEQRRTCVPQARRGATLEHECIPHQRLHIDKPSYGGSAALPNSKWEQKVGLAE